MAGTPIKKNARLWLTVGVFVGIFGLTAAGHEPSPAVLAFLGSTLTAYVFQSQAGQRYGEKVAKGAPNAGPPA